MKFFSALPDDVPRFERYYDIHGISCAIVSNCQHIFSLLHKSLEDFSCSRIVQPMLTFWFFVVPPRHFPSVSPSNVFQYWGSSANVTYYRSGTSLFFQYAEKGIWFTDIKQGQSIGYAKEPCSFKELSQICREMLLPSLFCLLRAQGISRIHASAVSFDGKGIVITGPSGQGKTTLLLHLLREGFHYVADDNLLLPETQDVPDMLSFSTWIGVSSQTALFFPELSSLIHQTLPDDQGKYRVDLRRIYNLTSVPATVPLLLLFPQVTPAEETTLAPLAKMDAAMQCLSENMFVTGIRESKRYFALLSGRNR